MKSNPTMTVDKYTITVLTEYKIIVVFINQDKKMIHNKYEFELLGSRGRAYPPTKDYQSIILIDNSLDMHQQIATLAHELSHTADDIMEYIEADDKSGEIKAHIIGYTIQQVLLKKKGTL